MPDDGPTARVTAYQFDKLFIREIITASRFFFPLAILSLAPPIGYNMRARPNNPYFFT